LREELPDLLAAGSALALLLGACLLKDGLPIFLFPLLPASFLPQLLLSSRRRLFYAGRLLLFLTLGLLCGVLSITGRDRLEPFFGVPSERVMKVRGSLYRDPVLTSSGGALVSLRLEEALSGNGVLTSAGGVLNLYFSREGKQLRDAMAGTPVSVGIRRAETGDDVFYPEPGTLRLTGPGSRAAEARSSLLREAGKRLARSPEAEGLLEALLLGRKSEPSDPVFLLFRQAGASHILALSGMHVGILAALLLFLLSPLAGRKKARLLVLALLPVYLLVVGVRPSLVRAIIFFFIAGTAPYCGERPLRALTITFLVQIVLFPLSPAELSFQLSYLALFGIISLSGPLSGILTGPLCPPAAAKMVGASCAAIISTAFLSLLRFGELRPASIPASFLLAVPVLLLIWAGVLLLLFPALPGIPAAAGWLSGFIIFIADYCSRLPVFRDDDALASAAAFLVLTSVLTVRYLLSDGTPFRLRFARRYLRLSSAEQSRDAETLRPEFSDLSRCEGKAEGTPRAG
jgi:competence protein ComEC